MDTFVTAETTTTGNTASTGTQANAHTTDVTFELRVTCEVPTQTTTLCSL